MNKLMQKEKDHAFGKDVYLLGADRDGWKYWLEAPSWDCGWYWGFGYVETYRDRRKPSNALDINSHGHIEGLLGEGEDKNGGYCHNLFDSVTFIKTTFTEQEGWILTELFRQFYLFREMADFWHNRSCGTTKSPILWNTKTAKKQQELFNEKMIPQVTAKIIEMLSP